MDRGKKLLGMDPTAWSQAERDRVVDMAVSDLAAMGTPEEQERYRQSMRRHRLDRYDADAVQLVPGKVNVL